MVALLFAISSCNIEDGGVRTAGLVSGGYPGLIKTIDGATITYDSQQRVSQVTYIEDGYMETYSYSYSSDSIILTIECRDDEDSYSGKFCAYLDESGYITRVDEYDDGIFYDRFIFTYSNGLVASANSDIATWDVNCNMTNVGDDEFTYNTALLNNANLDINMFLTNSEELSFPLLGTTLTYLSNVKGFRSTNMIDSCNEEGRNYNVYYQTDSQGRVVEASWSKYGTGSSSISVTYY